MGFLFVLFNLCFMVMLFCPYWAFDDFDHNHVKKPEENSGPMPKDKILLKSINKLTFYRNKRTTSRRTHSIHQLSCVGGTAGCKLFTPNVVNCDNAGFDEGKSKFNWKCQADVSDRVTFNHVEVICEGYDYPEDDYILLGSCGLEFTLDYKDPHDYHHNSYFKHMDDHEKELHHERVRATAKPKASIRPIETYWGLFDQLVVKISSEFLLISIFIVLLLCLFLFIRVFASRKSGHPNSKKQSIKRGSSYGPLTSAVLTTKKAC